MKPYQFYLLDRFPMLEPGQSVRNQIQMTFFGADEDVETTITLETEKFEQSLDLLRVKSEIKHSTMGFIKVVEDDGRRRYDFSEYLEPVDFPAYRDSGRKLLLFQAPKKVCKGVVANLRGNPCGVDLAEVQVDFGKVLAECSEYLGAWFKGVSARVRAASLSGDQIQEDALFRSLLAKGDLSGVTVPWVYGGAEHRIMVTRRGGIVLVQDYRNNLGLELNLVLDVYERLLLKVWSRKDDADKCA